MWAWWTRAWAWARAWTWAAVILVLGQGRLDVSLLLGKMLIPRHRGHQPAQQLFRPTMQRDATWPLALVVLCWCWPDETFGGVPSLEHAATAPCSLPRPAR